MPCLSSRPSAFSISSLERQAAADVHRQGDPLELIVSSHGKGGDARQKLRRDVIDAEKADILQRVHCHRLSRAGKSAHDQKLHTCSLLCFYDTNFFF